MPWVRLDPANPQWTAGRTGLFGGGSEAESRPIRWLALPRLSRTICRRERSWSNWPWNGATSPPPGGGPRSPEIQVEDADAHRLLAAALVELNQLDRAIEEFEVAIELNPAHLQQRFALHDALLQAQQPAKAKRSWRNCSAATPSSPRPTPCWKASTRSLRMERRMEVAAKAAGVEESHEGSLFRSKDLFTGQTSWPGSEAPYETCNPNPPGTDCLSGPGPSSENRGACGISAPDAKRSYS